MKFNTHHKTVAINANGLLTPTERYCLEILNDHLHPLKRVAFPTQQYLANLVGVGKRQIQNILRKLRELGFIRQVFRNGSKVVAWKVSLTRKWRELANEKLPMKRFAKQGKDLKKQPANPRETALGSEMDCVHSKPFTNTKGGLTTNPPLQSQNQNGHSPLNGGRPGGTAVQTLQLKTKYQEKDKEYLTEGELEKLTDEEMLAHYDKRERLLRMLKLDYNNRFHIPPPRAMSLDWECNTEKGINTLRVALATNTKLTEEQ